MLLVVSIVSRQRSTTSRVCGGGGDIHLARQRHDGRYKILFISAISPHSFINFLLFTASSTIFLHLCTSSSPSALPGVRTYEI